MSPLGLVCGAFVGLSLGLTGGGGAIIAVPLLVYALGVSPREAVGISLAAVGTTAFVGFLRRWRSGDVETRVGLLFAAAGVLGAPLGSWLAGRLPEGLLLVGFAGLMVVVAVRMWRHAGQPDGEAAPPSDVTLSPAVCRRLATGQLVLSPRCAQRLLVLGVVTGVLSGLFGVGGGFVIVPALVLVSGLPMRRAVATSLLVVSLVSASGVLAHLWAGRALDLGLAATFVAGGLTGLFAGQALARRLPVPVLERVFAAAIVGVAVFVLARNLAS